MPEPKKAKPFLANRWMGFGIEIALNMLVPILIGQWADSYFDIRPAGIVAGAIVGFISFIWTLYKISRE